MSRTLLFLLYAGLGLLSRPLFVGVSALGKRLRVKPVTVVLDVLFSAVAVGAAVLAAFLFNDGILALYNVAAAVIGYALAAAVF